MGENLLRLVHAIIHDVEGPEPGQRDLETLAESPMVRLWLTQKPRLLSRLSSDRREKVLSHYYQSKALGVLRQQELHRVLDLLHQAGVQVTLLKGAAHLAIGLYPDVALRPMGDLDLWIPAEEMPRAIKALTAEGYRVVDKVRRPVALRIRYAQEIELQGKASIGEAVDLHYRPFQGMWTLLVARIPQASLWEQRRPIPRRGGSAHVLSPEDHLIHLAYHFSVNHHLGYPGIRTLIDMDLVLRAWPVDWTRLYKRAVEWHISTVMWVGLTLLRRLAGNAVPSSIVHSLAPPRWQRLALSALMPDAKGLLYPRAREGRTRYLLDLLLCDSPRDWLRLIAWTLWPEREWIRYRYGSDHLWQRARHLWRVFTHPLF